MTNDQSGRAQAAPEDVQYLHAQLQAAMKENRRLREALGEQGGSAPADVPPEQLPPQAAMEALSRDPVGFIQALIDRAAKTHLADLKEEAELRAAVHRARKEHPEFERFEPFIMQEVAALIQEDEDGAIDPWDKLLAKGLERFQAKFRETLRQELPVLEKQGTVPFMEGASPRSLPPEPPSFSRAQIARMSLDEFLRHEAAINQALQKGRIH